MWKHGLVLVFFHYFMYHHINYLSVAKLFKTLISTETEFKM